MEKEEFNEKLIMEVEASPSIYNKMCKEYKDRYKKEEAWLKVANILNEDGNLFVYFLQQFLLIFHLGIVYKIECLLLCF